jgi:hypothetical protein
MRQVFAGGPHRYGDDNYCGTVTFEAVGAPDGSMSTVTTAGIVL